MCKKAWNRLAIFVISFLMLIAGIKNGYFVYALDQEKHSGYQFVVTYDAEKRSAAIIGNDANVDGSVKILSIATGDKTLDLAHPELTVTENGEYTFQIRYEQTTTVEGNKQTTQEEETLSVTVDEIEEESAKITEESADQAMPKALSAPLAETVYEVANKAEHTAAINKIASSAETKATIKFTSNITSDLTKVIVLTGVSGKHITYQAADGITANVMINNESTLAGDLTLDNVRLYSKSTYAEFYCGGHLFETTERTTVSAPYESVAYTIYGGGADGKDVTGGANIILRGGIFKSVYGGGKNSNVTGNVNITIGSMIAQDKSLVKCQSVSGGGLNGSINGNINLKYYSGTVSGGSIYGGSDGENSAAPLEINGDINVQLGYAGMNNDVISYSSVTAAGRNTTVKNVNLAVYDNGNSTIYAGYENTILGDVDLSVAGSGDKGHDIYVAGQGTMNIGGDVDVSYSFINTASSEYGFPTLEIISGGTANIGGDVTVDLSKTDQTYQFERLSIDQDSGTLNVAGDCVLNINADVKAGYLRGNSTDTSGNGANAKNTINFASGVQAKIGTIQQCGNIFIKEQANVEINSNYFPVTIPSTSEEEGRGADPFSYCYHLTLEKGSVLNTRNVTCAILGNVVINEAEWWKKGTVAIRGNYTAHHAKLYIPAVISGQNYGTASSNAITLRIFGEAKGDSTVYLMDRTNWTETASVIGDNYIAALKLADDAPAQSVFVLHKENADDQHYLKRVDDVKYATYYMWQINREIVYDYQKIYAEDLSVYEGGLGTGSKGQGAVGNALPEPHWQMSFADMNIKVGDQEWSINDQGLPFTWEYRNLETGEVVKDSARAGVYGLYVYPLKDHENEIVSIGNQQALYLPADGWKAAEIKVRDITDNESADDLSNDMFKAVYNYHSPLAGRLRNMMVFSRALLSDSANSALNGTFDETTGTHSETCDQSQPHAHVYPGTKFLKNGKTDLPVNAYARIGLLWDDLLDDVLGSQARMDTLHEKSLKALPDTFTSDQAITRKFQYIDLVDMNDGNIWVGTENENVTIYMPYTDEMTKDDTIAVTYFDGLTRDYTVNMDQADLDAEIAKSNAHALKVTKTDTGILFDVPSKQFGPFEVMWQKQASLSKPETPSVDKPNDQPSNIKPTESKPQSQVSTGDTTDTTIWLSLLAVSTLAFAVIVLKNKKRRKAE